MDVSRTLRRNRHAGIAAVAMLLTIGCSRGSPEPGALLAAVGEQDVVRVAALLAAGADPDERSPEGVTPLHRAAATGNLALVDLLLARHASVDAECESEGTPLLVAVRERRVEVVARLLEADADANVLHDGIAPLHLAAIQQDVDIARLLLAAEADVDATSEDGTTALTFAQGNARLVGLLRAHGARR